VTDGLYSIPLFVGLAALFFFARRSETIQGLGGPGRDERWALIDLTATALAGTVVLLVLVGCWLYELASGRDGSRTPSCWRSAASPISPPWRCCASGAS
jgi:hypothetical protein